jgi:type IV pilus assembly protein PilF
MKTKIIFLFVLLLFLYSCASTENISDKNSAMINTKLGLAYFEEGKIKTAKEKLLLANQRDPRNFLTLDALGYFYQKTGNSKLAENYYLSAIKNADGDGAALNNYGNFLYQEKRYQEALAYFLKAAKTLSYLNVSLAYQNAGFAAKALGENDLAKQYFSLAVLNDPKNQRAIREVEEIK